MHTKSAPPMGQSRIEGCYHLNKSFFSVPRVYGGVRLIQIGRLHCKSNSAIAEHAHIDWFELTVATDGKGIVYTNGTAVPISRGEIYLSFPWDHHAILSDDIDPLKYDFFAFSAKDTELSEDLLAIMEANTAAERRIFRDETIASLISAATSELDSGLKHSERLLGALLSEIVIRTMRAFSRIAPAEVPRAESSDALCHQLMHYIDTHIYTMDSLEELADFTGYNYSYLSALFRRVTAESLSAYYMRRRLETARLHIMENVLSITEIAELLRYSSIYTFSRAFKSRFGISPEQYRKNAALE